MPFPSPARIAAMHLAIRLNRMRALVEGLSSRGPTTFGILGAYVPGSRHQNKARHGELLGDLQRMGYHRAVPLSSQWQDEVSALTYSEKSYIVPGMRAADLFALGRKYGQDAVIYKSADGVLGLYHNKESNVEVAIRADGSIPYEMSSAQDLYSKDRGNSFSFDFLFGQHLPWDGHTPITHQDVQDAIDKGLIVPAS